MKLKEKADQFSLLFTDLVKDAPKQFHDNWNKKVQVGNIGRGLVYYINAQALTYLPNEIKAKIDKLFKEMFLSKSAPDSYRD
ncbi:MAG TPA: hypothetical protein VN958_17915 [Chitinophagaceae bacterium]|nr:hypothetical protein [Chitinophagaceae bacterium]